MDEEKCEIHRTKIEQDMRRMETRLNNHGDRIDSLEQYRSGTEQQIKNLVDQMKNLVTTMRWAMGLFGSAFVGFFFWAVQQGLFK